MARTTESSSQWGETFNVVVESVIGTVDVGSPGSHPTAVHAAMALIADWTTENAKGTSLAGGSFSFPDPYGGVVHVDVNNV